MENPPGDSSEHPNFQNNPQVLEDQAKRNERKQRTSINGQPLLTEETMEILLNDLEQKEKTISSLQEQVKQLNKQLQIKTDAINSIRLHCVNVISKKDEELKQARMQIGNGFPGRKESHGGKNKTRTGQTHTSQVSERPSITYLLPPSKPSHSKSISFAFLNEQIEKEELQQSLHSLRESSLHHSTEMQQMKTTLLTVRQELDRVRQEHQSTEKEYYRVEMALRKNTELVLEQQQKLAETTERRNSLAILTDDQKREIRLLETNVEELKNKLDRLHIDFDSLQLQKRHLEHLVQSDAEKYELLLSEYNEMKKNYKDLFIRYMDLKSDNDRLQRQSWRELRC
ncbi:uncharacterized protein [Blastocystis hominis]|uniref:Uncharacterized protein n=1 Tax=Blastocystis hominis TaxID=12968 RepID=D8LWI5_BLAHO|nr:uncharacterized protein [Blastocystis hominis]CBK20174.2 unnamed protein product [Blastocystis hominis]|eukprot:XP_012894222.1 uncharacterized protein [Blastocystis hominis]